MNSRRAIAAVVVLAIASTATRVLAEEQKAPAPVAKQVRVTAETAPLMDGEKVLATLKKGECCPLLQTQPPLHQVRKGDLVGWVRAELVAVEDAPPTKAADDPTVYITKTGAKYHTVGWQYLRQSSTPIPLSDAKAKGYGPCSRCRPPM